MAPWTDADDRKLLLSVISLAQVNPVWEDVGTHLGRTSESVRYAPLKTHLLSALVTHIDLVVSVT